MDRKKKEIEGALHQFASGDLADNAIGLLNVLGYKSQRTMRLRPNTLKGFLSAFDLEDEGKFNQKRTLAKKWESIDLLFQLTNEEIRDNRNLEIDFGGGGIDTGRMESYLFFAIKLEENHYTRTLLSQITREINKSFKIPAMILFQHGDTLSFTVIDRRLNERDESKDVLKKATLIKDIKFSKPKRGHTEILFDLSIDRLYQKHKFRDFPGLHQAWKETLDTEPLNREFYNQLFKWFEWVVKEAKFPEDEKYNLNAEEHVIRLITRILFVWFIKEKGLIADELFNKAEVANWLKDFKPDSGDSYYRVVLQNLFFATLNTEIGERRFSKGTNADHRNFSVYRYKNQMSHPDILLALFAKTPFINGGLFDCLDSEEATRYGGYRIDCFADSDFGKLSIPNRLFYDKDDGLFPLLNHYKFTVEENTPIEQDVALDPELLGRVFENLLAANTPESRTTVRKMTGSYYTPRPIVDYMVTEALAAVLARKCDVSGDLLRPLLDYAHEPYDTDEFKSTEIDKIVHAIAGLSILDPAVGSGAFPMSVLHKLTLALRRLDADNSRWEQLQKEKARQRAAAAFDTPDQQERNAELAEISDTFERYRDSDFGRKLYLIQNSIFGVDIQSIACQIAKLRFFISLTVEQEPTDKPIDNFGIKPLPNLETRFVAANTLIGLEGESVLTSTRAKTLEQELRHNRERHFHAATRSQKLAYKREDRELRRELAKELKQIGMPADDAERIANWDPYDQNASEDWFDSEWMFGISDGFDVVIGNPPYIRIQEIDEDFAKVLKNSFASATGKFDVYVCFMEHGFFLLKENGILTLITPNKFFNAAYGKGLREFITGKYALQAVVDFGNSQVFESATNYTCIIQLIKAAKRELEYKKIDSGDDFIRFSASREGLQKLKHPNSTAPWIFINYAESQILEKLSAIPHLGTVCNEIFQGLISGGDKLFYFDLVEIKDDAFVGRSLLNGDLYSFEKELCFLLLKGAEIKRYSPIKPRMMVVFPYYEESGKTLLIPEHILKSEFPKTFDYFSLYREQLENRGSERMEYEAWYSMWCPRSIQKFTTPKILTQVLASRANYTLDLTNKSMFVGGGNAGVYGVIPRVNLKYILALLNSKLLDYVLQRTSTQFQGGFYSYARRFIEKLPIKIATEEIQQQLISLADRILDAKCRNPDTDVTALENEIDEIVYSLYELSPEEIAIVEENTV